MKTRKWIIALGLAFFVVAILALRPVRIPDEKDCLSLKGTVSKISVGGVNDVVFKLQGIDKEFYVNRGLERGLDLNKLQTELLEREIVIKYANHWTPLDPANSIRHVSKLELDGKTIFTELD